MVFCGKPSKGCHACRAKKTRCDAKPDGCGQCFKAGRVCPGYRREADVMFRDESSNVIKKAKAREAKKAAAAAAAELRTSSSSSVSGDEISIDSSIIPINFDFDGNWDMVLTEDLSPVFSTPTPPLLPSVEDRALAFFVSNYVIGANGPIRGHLDQVHEFYSTTHVDETILASIQAVGLAGYSYTVGSPSVLMDARKTYARALRLTNEALRDPIACKKDSTASAIVILGIFEMVTGCSPKSIDAWAEHIKGAAALLKLRGYEQLETVSGCRLLGQITASLIISSLQYGFYIPDHILDLFDAAGRGGRLGDPAWQVQKMMIDVVNLCASLRDGTLSEPRLILDTVLEMDERLKGFLGNPPPGWEFETIYTDFPAEYVFHNKYQVYMDYWVASMFNLLRTARILLHEQIRRLLLKGFASQPPTFSGPEYTKQLQETNDVLTQVSEDIFCSVPQHLGFVVKESLLEVRHRVRNTIMHPASRAAGGYFLLWPLCAAGSSDIATDEMREFAVRGLEYIGQNMGIQLAFALIKMISPP